MITINLKGNAEYLKKNYIMDENDSLSEYNKIPLGHNRTNGAVYSKMDVKVEIRGGFLIRRSSAIRRFIAGFLRCDNRTIMKSFLKIIACEFSGNFVRCVCKFLVNSRSDSFDKTSLLYDYHTSEILRKTCESQSCV